MPSWTRVKFKQTMAWVVAGRERRFDGQHGCRCTETQRERGGKSAYLCSLILFNSHLEVMYLTPKNYKKSPHGQYGGAYSSRASLAPFFR